LDLAHHEAAAVIVDAVMVDAVIVDSLPPGRRALPPRESALQQ